MLLYSRFYFLDSKSVVPKKRHSKSKVGRRRSHLALKRREMHPCASCNGPTVPHRACAQCGVYKKIPSTKLQK
ncbi:MAG: 50S ribosomal protein L32 [Nanoarchaeota archaeon]|nr:50S ribosomal protein L32 [Nanoarchaeota archaeon]